MESYEFRQHYWSLYEYLKGPGLDTLLQSEAIDGALRETIRLIANLPHPAVATWEQVQEICMKCSAGNLEYLQGVEEMEETVMALVTYPASDELDQGTWFPLQVVDGYTPEHLAMILYHHSFLFHQNFMILSGVKDWVGKIGQHTDYTLKSLCPGCDGDLEVFIENNELRIRCKECYDFHSPSSKSWRITSLSPLDSRDGQ